ncbi:hypothetical protein OESDEN_15532 [Oesophagostomum dentatum]|uniref:Cse1 n=1 Tax=Oesophagostomum dentatum TaxID=61180 RepID=A0A0B1SLI8_OESDE|nr:hypothetical protein OESDEN_15532 [Oesophagostomum dentatum]
MKLDVVYCLVTAIASKTETAKSGATSTSQLINVADYYAGQVRGHLSSNINETPILKTDALKFVVIFRNQLPAEVLVEVVQAADRLLTARLPILHKYAAYAIDKLLLVKEPNGTGPLLTARVVPVGSLLNNLVSGFDKDAKAQNSPYLIKAILRCVAILDEETARHGHQIASKLSSLVAEATKNPADAVHTHFLFETMLVGSKSLDQYGFQLANAILPVVEMTQGVENPMTVLLNNMFRRVQFSKTPKFMKHFVVFLCRFAVVRGAELLAKSVEAIQAGMFRMLLEKVIVTELNGLQNMTTAEDKRTIAIGIANILADATNYVGDQYGALAVGVAQLVEAPSASDRPVLSPEEEQASMYNAEGEFTNPYCRLSYAPDQIRLFQKSRISKIISHELCFNEALQLTQLSKHVSRLNCGRISWRMPNSLSDFF